MPLAPAPTHGTPTGDPPSIVVADGELVLDDDDLRERSAPETAPAPCGAQRLRTRWSEGRRPATTLHVAAMRGNRWALRRFGRWLRERRGRPTCPRARALRVVREGPLARRWRNTPRSTRKSGRTRPRGPGCRGNDPAPPRRRPGCSS